MISSMSIHVYLSYETLTSSGQNRNRHTSVNFLINRPLKHIRNYGEKKNIGKNFNLFVLILPLRALKCILVPCWKQKTHSSILSRSFIPVRIMLDLDPISKTTEPRGTHVGLTEISLKSENHFLILLLIYINNKSTFSQHASDYQELISFTTALKYPVT